MENKRVMKLLPKKHLWKPEEDLILKNYVEAHGEGNWATVSHQSGLMRGGKSCRLRWKNYLRPNIKRGVMSEEEEDIILRMHKLIGNRWSLIAGRLPGRTDNEVKNYWNTHLNKRCPKRKRKCPDTSGDQNDTHSPKTAPEKNKTGDDAQFTIAEIPNTDGSEKVKAEEKNIQLSPSSVGRDVKSFNGAVSIFDDEPLPTYVESFLFFEAFGYTVGEVVP